MRKKEYKEQNQKLINRVKELEEILCPCEQHDFIEVGKYLVYDLFGDCYDRYKYICKNCKKVTYKDRW